MIRYLGFRVNQEISPWNLESDTNSIWNSMGDCIGKVVREELGMSKVD